MWAGTSIDFYDGEVCCYFVSGIPFSSLQHLIYYTQEVWTATSTEFLDLQVYMSVITAFKFLFVSHINTLRACSAACILYSDQLSISSN
jgi:hypothetical protein